MLIFGGFIALSLKQMAGSIKVVASAAITPAFVAFAAASVAKIQARVLAFFAAFPSICSGASVNEKSVCHFCRPYYYSYRVVLLEGLPSSLCHESIVGKKSGFSSSM